MGMARVAVLGAHRVGEWDLIFTLVLPGGPALGHIGAHCLGFVHILVIALRCLGRAISACNRICVARVSGEAGTFV